MSSPVKMEHFHQLRNLPAARLQSISSLQTSPCRYSPAFCPIILPSQKFRINAIIWYTDVCIYLLSLNIILLRLIYFIACFSNLSFLWLNTITMYGYTSICIIHLPVLEHLGCFEFWSPTNKGVRNIFIQVFM